MGRIGKWRPAIRNAKTIPELNNLNKNLNNRIKLRNNIKKSVLTRKEQSEYANMVMKLNLVETWRFLLIVVLPLAHFYYSIYCSMDLVLEDRTMMTLWLLIGIKCLSFVVF